jgi:hypothetical protein
VEIILNSDLDPDPDCLQEVAEAFALCVRIANDQALSREALAEPEVAAAVLRHLATGASHLPQLASQIAVRMERLARVLAEHGWTLRTGLAEGSDQAFYRGASSGGGDIELYLPWPSFERAARIADSHDMVLERPSEEACRIAERFHPVWGKQTRAGRALHARNSHQVLGRDLKTPAGLVICWTRNGSRDGKAAGTGGTGQALRIATAYGIPVLNIGRSDDEDRVRALLASSEASAP